MSEAAGSGAGGYHNDPYEPRFTDIIDELWKLEYLKRAEDFSIEYDELGPEEKEARKEMLWIQMRRAWWASLEKKVPFEDLMSVAGHCRKYNVSYRALSEKLFKYNHGVLVGSESLENTVVNTISVFHDRQQTLTVDECVAQLQLFGAPAEANTRWFTEYFLKKWAWKITTVSNNDRRPRPVIDASVIKEFYMRLAWEMEDPDYDFGSATGPTMAAKDGSSEEGLLDPGQLFSLDEAGVKSRVTFVVPIYEKKLHDNVLAAKEGLKTVAETMCADGTLLPPFILVAQQESLTGGERKELGIPDDWEIQGHVDARMTQETFMGYLAHFDKNTRGKSHKKRILVLDNAPVYRGREIDSFCRGRNIAVVDLPQDCTQLLHPGSVGLFANCKSTFQKEWADTSNSTLGQDASGMLQRKLQFFRMLEKMREGLTPATVLHGFKVTGIRPLDPWAMRNYQKGQ